LNLRKALTELFDVVLGDLSEIQDKEKQKEIVSKVFNVIREVPIETGIKLAAELGHEANNAIDNPDPVIAASIDFLRNDALRSRGMPTTDEPEQSETPTEEKGEATGPDSAA